MADSPNSSAFILLIGNIARILLDTVKAELGHRAWKTAYVDTLWPPKGVGHGGLRKFRVELLDGSLWAAHTPMEARSLIDEAWEFQKGLFPATWYGLKVKIFSDGKWDAEY